MLSVRMLGRAGKHVIEALRRRFDRGPIASIADLQSFIRTRSAYIAQTSLFGYLKTRMGTSYPQLFEDDVFSKAISQASRRVFVACASDLTVFAVASVTQHSELSRQQADALARSCFAGALGEIDADTADRDRRASLNAFAHRIRAIDWDHAAEGEQAFTLSPKELLAAAPVTDEMKAADAEIVTNSIRFRWHEVRTQLRTRLDGAAIGAELRRSPPSDTDA